MRYVARGAATDGALAHPPTFKTEKHSKECFCIGWDNGTIKTIWGIVFIVRRNETWLCELGDSRRETKTLVGIGHAIVKSSSVVYKSVHELLDLAI